MAISPASPAQAHHDRPSKAERCEQGVERLETRFRQIEEQRGYEAATKWWERAWEKYYERCLAPLADREETRRRRVSSGASPTSLLQLICGSPRELSPLATRTHLPPRTSPPL